MNLEHVIQSEVSQKEKNKYHVNTWMWNLLSQKEKNKYHMLTHVCGI